MLAGFAENMRGFLTNGKVNSVIWPTNSAMLQKLVTEDDGMLTDGNDDIE
ncbi:Uncharacterised protein [Vibrio cholerae]|nr:Uncharacterised protein [Vibrio cholerae]